MKRWRCCIAFIALALLAVRPAYAAQSDPTTDLADALPVPAERGKPTLDLRLPEPLPNRSSCLPAVPCGTRLFGTVEKNGAIGVQVPALRW